MDDRTAQHAQDTYRVNQIQMASREQLLIITYDIGIRACSAAERAMEGKDVEQINANLQRAQAVIRELMITLNTEQGGDVAHSLMRLYDYMYYQLVDANVKKETAPVAAVRNMLEELKVTWMEAIAKLKVETSEKAQAVPGRPMVAGGTNFAY